MKNLEDREKRATFRLETNQYSNVKNVIAVVSGKGGVGKSLVTSLLAMEMANRGYKTAILDADITGPSIPKSFGLHGKLSSGKHGIEAMSTNKGIKITSTNLLIDTETSAVVWRAPMLTGAIRQFWQDITWGEIDYMFVDLPPGTSDAQLTIFQSIPLMGIVIVTSPQELVSMIVEKAMDMATRVGIPVIGVIENFSYFLAPDTGKKYEIFGKSKTHKILDKYNLNLLANIPIKPEIAEKIDEGKIEEIDTSFMKDAVNKILEFEENEF